MLVKAIHLLIFIIPLSVFGQQVTVQNPNSNTTWYKNQQNVEIEWSSSGISGNVNIHLMTPATNQPYSNIAINTANDGYQTWDVATNVVVGTYYVRVSALDGSGIYGDSEEFEIINQSQSITVTTPTSSTIWSQGEQNVQILWNSEGITGKVSIHLFRNTNVLKTITGRTDNDGTYSTWDVSTSIAPATNYYIRIQSEDFPNVIGESQYFTIAETSLDPEITVNPSALNFGDVEVGTSSLQSVVVTNTGGGLLAGNASIAFPYSINSGGSYSLLQGESKTIYVEFSPPVASEYSKTLQLTGAGGRNINCSGSGMVENNIGEGISPVGTLSSIDISGEIDFINTYRDRNKYILIQSLDQNQQPFKICADGSNATKIVIHFDQIDNNNIDMRVKDDPNEDNIALYGSIRKDTSDLQSATFVYTHPYILDVPGVAKSSYFQFVDETNNDVVLYEQPISLYRTPVVLVHGLLSSASAFEIMEDFLLDEWFFAHPELVYSMDYSSTNASAFSVNSSIYATKLYDYITHLIDICDYSVGAVDIVCHSMGGILSRLYLQKTDYQWEIKKLITLNTPHSGSQMANVLVSTSPGPVLISDLFFNITGWASGRALIDLAVDSEAILEDLNGPGINYHTTPSHSVITIADLGVEPPNNLAWDILLARLILLLNLPDITLDLIFNNSANDLIVAVPSQEGGLAASSVFYDQSHMGAQNNPDVINRVIELLDANMNFTLHFSTNGYNPPILSFPKSNNKILTMGIASGDIELFGPFDGEVFSPGETINLSANGTGDVNKILFTASSLAMNPISQLTESASGEFEFVIPQSASGMLKLTALGFSNDGFVAMDSLWVNVEIPADIDSLKIEPGKVTVIQDSYTTLSVKGYFSDGYVRNITKNNLVAYSTADEGIAKFEDLGLLKGISIDSTTATANYKGKTATITVDVVDNNIVGIKEFDEDNDKNRPESYRLLQNYPNPFNPITTISFELPESNLVKLTVYNILGQRVKELVNKELSAGHHKFQFDGSAFASGVYFYRLSAGDFNSTKKMIIIK